MSYDRVPRVPKPKQHDAHVRARKRLIRRIVNRRYDWGLTFGFKGMTDAELCTRAARALVVHQWRPGWGDKRGGGQYRDVPSYEIHKLMGQMRM